MRLRRVSFRGITRFTGAQPVSLEFDGLGELVAVVGRNGHGKTTALEAVAAALYKTLPSRPGSLYEHCHGRDAFVEAVFDDHGSEVKVRIQVDVEARKTEGYVFVDGAAITTGRSAEFEVEIEKRFGSLELFLASAFSAQNRAGNFLLMPKGDRKALFVELLGLRHLEVLQEGAKVRRAAAETVVAGARAVLASNEAEATGLPEAEGRLAVAQNAADAAAHALEAARSEEAAAVAALERARTAGARLAALEQAAGAATREAAAADVALADALKLAPQARADADRRRRALEAQDLDGQERRARERNARAIETLTTRRVNAEELLAEAPAVEGAVAELPGLRSERDELQAGEKRAEELGRAVQATEAHLAAAERRFKDAQATAERERARLERQAGLLGEVPCTTSSSWVPYESVDDAPALRERVTSDLATLCPLLADARRAKEAAAAVAIDPSIPEEIEAQRTALEQARTDHQDAVLACDSIRLQEVQARITELDAIAGLVPLVEEARRQIGTLEAERKAADGELESELRRLAAARDAVASTAQEIERDLDRALDHAHARVSDLRESLVAAEGRAGKAEQDLTAARKEGALTVSQAQASLSEARDTRVKGEQRLRTADQERATLEARVSALREKEAGLSRLRDAVSQAEQEVGDWSLLEKALGRDGVQALEIDAAGPEVARITNELLEACYGPRFSISFETLREKRSSRGEYSEAFDVRVFDQGNERTVEALSGGERVIVGEAIGLSLSIFNSRKSGIRWETLWRDESEGALDPENAQAYVEMLRRALALGGFSQVIFVSHQPEVWERADSRLFVADGRVKPEAVRSAESVPA